MASHVPTLIDRVSSVILSLVSFVPQMALMLVYTHRYFRQLGFCIILQTFTFVAFNKVCTVQVRRITIFGNQLLNQTLSVFYLVLLTVATRIALFGIQIQI